jgi:glycosyltransferase involved in cell wall biosynthesis
MLPKVAVVVPSGDTVHSRFMICLVSLFQYSLNKFDMVIVNPRSSSISNGRSIGIEVAKRRGCEYVLFLDSDMMFPYTTLEALYQAGKDIVGATYVKRLLPTSLNHVELEGAPRIGNGVREVLRLPTGCLLIRMEVFERMEAPYFRFFYPGDGTEVSEDFYFCDKARELGYGVWLEADLSKLLGHLGVYNHELKDDDGYPGILN